MQHGVLGLSFAEQKLFYMHFTPSQGENSQNLLGCKIYLIQLPVISKPVSADTAPAFFFSFWKRENRINSSDQYQYLGNCPLTPPLTQQ